MQITPDLFALGLLFEALICIPIFLIASLFIMKLIDLISSKLGTFIRYLAFPGVVLHEVCHSLLCRITGVPIVEHRLFLGKQEGIARGVIVDAKKIQNFTSGFLVAFAPLLILALGLYLLIAFWQVLPMHQGLALYFAFCFFIGLSPSKADVQLVVSVAKDRPSQTLLELGLLSFPLATGFAYLVYSALIETPFSFLIFSGAILGGGVVSLLLWQGLNPHRNS